MGLLTPRKYYKPFEYPWAFEAYLTQQKMHWLPEEVPLNTDVHDWNKKLSDEEKSLLAAIFRFFVVSDVDVGSSYADLFIPVFKPPEVRMMLSAFMNMEAIHMHAYSLLLDTIGMPETEYKAFLKYSEMVKKHEFLNNFSNETPREILKSIAVVSAFTEGLQLFSTFAILLNFTRFGKMKGMGQIVSWSQRDEAVIEGTEVYVKDKGWVPIEDVRVGDLIKEFDIRTRKIQFNPVMKKVEVKRSLYYKIYNDQIEQIVSPGHRMIVYNVLTDKILELTAEEMYYAYAMNSGHHYKYVVPGISILISDNTVGEPVEAKPSRQILKIEEVKRGENKTFYCLSVPGKSFYIRSGNRVSVTGNTLHVESMIKLFHALLAEYPHLWTNKLKDEIIEVGKTMVRLEDNFIDLIFDEAGGAIKGLTADEVKKYIRYIANLRFSALGINYSYDVKENPIPWIVYLTSSVEHTNFFELRATSYSKGSYTGSWEDVWGKFDQ